MKNGVIEDYWEKFYFFVGERLKVFPITFVVCSLSNFLISIVLTRLEVVQLGLWSQFLAMEVGLMIGLVIFFIIYLVVCLFKAKKHKEIKIY